VRHCATNQKSKSQLCVVQHFRPQSGWQEGHINRLLILTCNTLCLIMGRKAISRGDLHSDPISFWLQQYVGGVMEGKGGGAEGPHSRTGTAGTVLWRWCRTPSCGFSTDGLRSALLLSVGTLARTVLLWRLQNHAGI